MEKRRYFMKAGLRKILCMFLLLCIILVPTIDAQAAVRTGTYEKHFVGSNADSYRTVIIKKITKKQVVFQMCYSRSNPYKESYSAKITGKRKGNKVTFKYHELGWDVKGKGTMTLGNNYIKIKVTASPKGDGFLQTGGNTFKLKRVSGKKKFVG